MRLRWRRGWATLALVIAIIGVVFANASVVWSLTFRGHAPHEVFDYVAKRLRGHPRLESIADVPLRLTADWLGATPEGIRQQWMFTVPPMSAASQAKLVRSADQMLLVREGRAQPVSSLSEAARLSLSGDEIHLPAGDYFGESAVFRHKSVTIKGIGGQARLHAGQGLAEGKAQLVLGGGQFRVQNIAFIGARAPDKNGAGIRFEGGELEVSDCTFWGGDAGILTSGDSGEPKSKLKIERSEFGYIGHGDGYSHALYVGQIAELQVRASYFHHGYIGHLLKSRAKASQVLYSRFTDEVGGRSSYELNFPNGGQVLIRGVIVSQSATTENSLLISYGEEGSAWDVNELSMLDNTLVNGLSYGGRFVRVAGDVRGGLFWNNLLMGGGTWNLPTNVSEGNNPRLGWDELASAAHQDVRLANPERHPWVKPSSVGAQDVPLPAWEYQHPRNMHPVQGPSYLAGAVQTQVGVRK